MQQQGLSGAALEKQEALMVSVTEFQIEMEMHVFRNSHSEAQEE